jgi:16S rRNA (cytosine967-C5)-methyltransferase
VDAPCSGVGTWQRNPHARWSTQMSDVRELAQVQRKLLDHAATALKPGGRLVYSVCTLTRSETTEVAQSFTRDHTEFEPAGVFPVEGLVSGAQIFLWPHEIDANGMFIAAWTRR